MHSHSMTVNVFLCTQIYMNSFIHFCCSMPKFIIIASKLSSVTVSSVSDQCAQLAVCGQFPSPGEHY